MSTSILSAEDAADIAELLREAVLLPHDGSKLQTKNGIIWVTCSDGDKILDFLEHVLNIIREGNGRLRPHIFTEHGGAMVIAEDFPLYPLFRVAELMLAKIEDGHIMKNMDTVILMIHAPCSAAEKAHLNVIQELAYLIRGKRRIQEGMPNLDVACFIHVQDAEGNKVVHYVSSFAFEAWYKKRLERTPALKPTHAETHEHS